MGNEYLWGTEREDAFYRFYKDFKDKDVDSLLIKVVELDTYLKENEKKRDSEQYCKKDAQYMAIDLLIDQKMKDVTLPKRKEYFDGLKTMFYLYRGPTKIEIEKQMKYFKEKFMVVS